MNSDEQRHKACELALWLRPGKKQWEQRFFLPQRGPVKKPPPTSPNAALLPASETDGDTLFKVLFGSDRAYQSNLFALAFGADGPVSPTRAPLRLHLLSDENTSRWLYLQPWSRLSFQGRLLVECGWTIEWHPISALPAFPEYPLHTCHFPDRVVLLIGDGFTDSAHIGDIQALFQLHWQEHVPLHCVGSTDELYQALNTGSPRLLYYYGSTTSDGLTLQAGQQLSWPTLIEIVNNAPSLSLTFLNLIGRTGLEAFPHGRTLINHVKAAALWQCCEKAEAYAAAKTAVQWLEDVFVKRTDPVWALHRHHCGVITAWTRYDRWQITTIPEEPLDPDFINLILDRDRQRKELFGAKEDLYHEPLTRIYHVVAYGEAGNQVAKFPPAVKQYLVERRRPEELYFDHCIELDPRLGTTYEQIEDAVRRQLHWSTLQGLTKALLPEEVVMVPNTFCFVILHWALVDVLSDVESGHTAMRAVADWCQNRLCKAFAYDAAGPNLRLLSIMTLELAHRKLTDSIRYELEVLIDDYNAEPAFQFGELTRLSGVRKSDLQKFTRNPQLCRCTDRQRDQFPDLLLGERKEMPFAEALTTLRRGYPYNMGILFEELSKLTAKGLWPPVQYDPKFWG